MQRVGFTSSSLTTDVTLTITGTSSAKINNATLQVADEDGTTYSFGNDGDGVYTFTLPRGAAATVKITAPEYQPATVNITSSQTNLAALTLTQALTAATKSVK